MNVDDVMMELQAAIPEFEHAWQRYKRSDLYEHGEHYNHVAQLARFMAEQVKTSHTTGFRQLFATIESLLQAASVEVRDLVVVGFLEDLQTCSLNSGVPLDAWRDWLGPLTEQARGIVAGLWDGSVPKAQFNSYIETGTIRDVSDSA